MPVDCPICNKQVKQSDINSHIDSNCTDFIYDPSAKDSSAFPHTQPPPVTQSQTSATSQKRTASKFFSTPAPKRHLDHAVPPTPAEAASAPGARSPTATAVSTPAPSNGVKRSYEDGPGANRQSLPARDARPVEGQQIGESVASAAQSPEDHRPPKKRNTQSAKAAPLAERMRPLSLDSVLGQDLVGPNGILRSLITSNRLPSMILWGASGTGKTTIARCMATMSNSRFIELNATNTGVQEVKKLFAEAENELPLTGRRTIIFCDEIHRFNKSQQDVFLKPVEAGTVTLVGATTENPSFKVANALLSRCRVFTLSALTTVDIVGILNRALELELPSYPTSALSLLDTEMITYLAKFSDGDARTALNLLELALSLTTSSSTTKDTIKSSLTKTLVYDRAGDQHYDTISAFHKSVRGSDPDAALYYLARMLQSGEDPLFIARRMVVIASEDVGLADNSLLPLATATYTATQQIGLPEARIPLAHCATALCLAPKSTRAYRGLNNAYAALQEPGVAGLPVPIHLRNAPTRLMREMGYGADYKYPPNYKNGKVKQVYLPDGMVGRKFLEARDLGTEVDPEVEEEEVSDKMADVQVQDATAKVGDEAEDEEL